MIPRYTGIWDACFFMLDWERRGWREYMATFGREIAEAARIASLEKRFGFPYCHKCGDYHRRMRCAACD